jgi:hypothetical protein
MKGCEHCEGTGYMVSPGTGFDGGASTVYCLYCRKPNGSPRVYPGFRLLTGREPIAGKDYDADGTLCQDDYEYLTGTGRYSNKREEVTCWPDEEEG